MLCATLSHASITLDHFVNTRVVFKNKIHAELSNRWIDYSNIQDPFNREGKKYLRSLKIFAVEDCLEIIDFLDTKILEPDSEIKKLASDDKYAKHLITIPGISYYAALLISSEIADINRFPDYEHLSSYAKLVPGIHQSGETQYSKADMKAVRC
jgi:transposase